LDGAAGDRDEAAAQQPLFIDATVRSRPSADIQTGNLEGKKQSLNI